MLCPRHADPSADTPAIRRDQLDAEMFERRRDRLQRCGLWVSSPRSKSTSVRRATLACRAKASCGSPMSVCAARHWAGLNIP